MRLLESNPTLTQRDLASQLGISLGGINYCVKALIDKGWIKAQNFRKNDNKLGYSYLLTPSGVKEKSELTAQFLKRKLREYDDLRYEIERLKSEIKKN